MEIAPPVPQVAKLSVLTATNASVYRCAHSSGGVLSGAAYGTLFPNLRARPLFPIRACLPGQQWALTVAIATVPFTGGTASREYPHDGTRRWLCFP